MGFINNAKGQSAGIEARKARESGQTVDLSGRRTSARPPRLRTGARALRLRAEHTDVVYRAFEEDEGTYYP